MSMRRSKRVRSLPKAASQEWVRSTTHRWRPSRSLRSMPLGGDTVLDTAALQVGATPRKVVALVCMQLGRPAARPAWLAAHGRQGSRRRIWIEAGTRRFGSFLELNAWLGERCRSVWADTAHPIHRQFTVAEMWELEKPHLMSMPAPFDGYVERLARVSSTCLVAAARNRYSVPCEWAGHIVSTRVYPERIDVAAADAVVACHARLPGSGQTSYDWQHYIDLVQRKPGALRNGTPFLDLPAPLLRLRQSLLRHPGGDRVMAQVLAVVPQAGLEAVLVAIELVLEGRAPSGSISVEHVRNVLARLNNPATPAQAQTSLQLTQAPKADTARYDRLRPTHQDHLDGQEVGHA